MTRSRACRRLPGARDDSARTCPPVRMVAAPWLPRAGLPRRPWVVAAVAVAAVACSAGVAGRAVAVTAAQTTVEGACAALRPDWTAARGRVDALQELVLFIGSPLGLLLLALCVLSLIRRWHWPGFAAVALAMILTQVWTSELAGHFGLETARLAMAEGCMGPPAAKVAFAAAVAVVMFLWSERLRRRAARRRTAEQQDRGSGDK